MDYKVAYERKAIKQLAKIEKGQQNILLAWIKKNLVETNNPRKHGKLLTGPLKGYWRYRVGNYRILADIKDSEVTIIVINIGHRKDIYK